MRTPRPHRATLLAVTLLLAAGLFVPAPGAFGQATEELGQTSGSAPAAVIDPLKGVNPFVDLVFRAIAPCRIIDTRIGGGPIAAGTTRNFAVSGTTGFPAQGGTPGGCGIPDEALAAVINYVAVGPAGPGDLRVTPTGTPIPNASIINYAAVSGLNVANGVATPLSTGTAPHITVQADVSATHLVADVLGYYKTVSCQGGTVKALGQCFEIALRAPALFFPAADACGASLGRLAAPLELFLVRNVVGIAAAPPGEWTDFGTFVGASFVGMTVNASTIYEQHQVTDSLPFRCVYRPLP